MWTNYILGFSPEKKLVPKQFVSRKQFWFLTNFWSRKKIGSPKNLGPEKNICMPKNICLLKPWSQKNVGHKKNLCPEKDFCSKKNGPTLGIPRNLIFMDTHILTQLHCVITNIVKLRGLFWFLWHKMGSKIFVCLFHFEI